MLKFDKDITSGEKKQHDASALIYDLSHHVFRWLAYFSNGGASVLVSHSGLMSSHRVFWLDLIRQHPVTSGTPRLVKGQCCFLDNFRLLRIKRNPVGYLWHFQHRVIAKPDISVIVFEWVGITIVQYQGMSPMYRNTISASMLRHSLAFSLSDSCIKWLSYGWRSEEVKGSRTCPWRVISIDMFLPL